MFAQILFFVLATVLASNNLPPRNQKICQTPLPEIKALASGQSNRLPTFDQALIFQRVVNLLKQSHYSKAFRIYTFYFSQVFGKDFVQNGPSTDYFLTGDIRLGLIALYQDNFCNGVSHFVPDFYDANAVQPFEQALEDAIAGNYDKALVQDDVATSRDSQFSYPDILTGVLCEKLGDRVCARKHWLRAAATEGPALPETSVYPDRFVPVQLLLHFRP